MSFIAIQTDKYSLAQRRSTGIFVALHRIIFCRFSWYLHGWAKQCVSGNNLKNIEWEILQTIGIILVGAQDGPFWDTLTGTRHLLNHLFFWWLGLCRRLSLKNKHDGEWSTFPGGLLLSRNQWNGKYTLKIGKINETKAGLLRSINLVKL